MGDLLIIGHTSQGPVQGVALIDSTQFHFRPRNWGIGQRIAFEMEGKLQVQGTGRGVKFGFRGPTGSVLSATGFLRNASGAVDLMGDFTAFGQSIGQDVAAGSYFFKVSGIITVGAEPDPEDEDGEVNLQFCQNTNGAGGVTLLANQEAVWAKEESGGWS